MRDRNRIYQFWNYGNIEKIYTLHMVPKMNFKISNNKVVQMTKRDGSMQIT